MLPAVVSPPSHGKSVISINSLADHEELATCGIAAGSHTHAFFISNNNSTPALHAFCPKEEEQVASLSPCWLIEQEAYVTSASFWKEL